MTPRAKHKPTTGKGDTSPILEPLLQTKGALVAEYVKRRNPVTYKSAHPADQQQLIAEGWSVSRAGKKTVRMQRAKRHDAMLEDRAWCLFYRMGYPEIGGAAFRIRYQRADGTTGEKRLDIFAKDNETVVVGECKSRDIRGRRSLQKDLHETDSLQKPFADAIRRHYGREFKPKILWIYFTHNIIWSEPDVERANSIHVRIVTENEFNYFDAFIKHLGPAGRYQFLAEFLEGQTVPGLSNIKVPATRGKLGKHTFYSFVTTPLNLLKIAFINHLALNHPDGRPAYQRMISSSRITAIGDFIRHGGYFPTNLLINFTEACRFEQISNKDNTDPNMRFGWLHLPNKYKSAWVIDGQHRLYGYSHLESHQVADSLFVVAFEKMDTKTEADLFITINHKQKSVPKSILVALQADLKWGSTDARERIGALASALVKSLNSDPTSPFFQRFTVQGVAPKDNQNLTMPETVNGLVRANLLGRIGKSYTQGYLSGATDDETLSRARSIIIAYFGALRDVHSTRWDGGKNYYIATNPSIRAHLLLIAEILRYTQNKRSDFDPLVAKDVEIGDALKSGAAPVFAFVKSAPDQAVSEKFSRKFGEGGVKEYFYNLCEIIHARLPDFGSSEFLGHLARRADQRITETSQAINDMQKAITDFVITTLQKVYGTKEMKSGEKAYWELGIENSKAKEEAYKRQQAAPVEKRLRKEAYLDFLDLMKIVRQKENWPHFETVFNIPVSGEKGKVYYLDWWEKLNDLRRIPAHPSSMRVYDEEDYSFVSWLKAELYGRLEKTDFVDSLS